MERARLDSLSLDQLREEASRYNLPISESRDALIDDIMTHLERHGPLIDMFSNQSTQGLRPSPASQPAEAEQPPESVNTGTLIQVLSQFTTQMQQQQQQQQQLMQQIYQFMIRERNVHMSPGGHSQISTEANIPLMQMTGSEVSRQSTLSSVSPANAVNLLALQIPEFGGREEDNVRLWIQRVGQISHIHRVSDDITLLAAISKLKKMAKEWFDTLSGPALQSWSNLREAMLKMFDRRIPFSILIRRVEARRWIFSKETFQQYAVNKLSLMHALDLPVQDKINLLIGGISDRMLKSSATAVASLYSDSMDQFLDKMYHLTTATTDWERKAVSVKSNSFKDAYAKNVGKKGSSSKDNKDSEVTCFYCKAKGHRRWECPKLKSKELSTTTQSTSSVAAVAAPEATPTATVKKPEEEPTLTVAAVQQGVHEFPISNPVVKVVELNSRNCILKALINTGSPVSFITLDVFHNFFNKNENSLTVPSRKFNALNDLPIKIKGIINSTIRLEQFPDTVFDIELNVLEKNNFAHDLVIGRDFLSDKKPTIILRTNNNNDNSNDKLSEGNFPSALLRLDICEVSNTVESIIDECNIDFDNDVKKRLKQLVVEV